MDITKPDYSDIALSILYLVPFYFFLTMYNMKANLLENNNIANLTIDIEYRLVSSYSKVGFHGMNSYRRGLLAHLVCLGPLKLLLFWSGAPFSLNRISSLWSLSCFFFLSLIFFYGTCKRFFRISMKRFSRSASLPLRGFNFNLVLLSLNLCGLLQVPCTQQSTRFFLL